MAQHVFHDDDDQNYDDHLEMYIDNLFDIFYNDMVYQELS